MTQILPCKVILSKGGTFRRRRPGNDFSNGLAYNNGTGSDTCTLGAIVIGNLEKRPVRCKDSEIAIGDDGRIRQFLLSVHNTAARGGLTTDLINYLDQDSNVKG